jgi:hypothetical protein
MSGNLGLTRAGVITAKCRKIFGASAQIQEGDLYFRKKFKANDVGERWHLNGSAGGAHTPEPGEIYIAQNDLVVPYAMRVSVSKVLDATKPGNVMNADDLSYADINLFSDPATAGAVSEADCIKGFFHSTITMKANSYELLNQMSLIRFYHSPQTQGSATTQPQIDDRSFIPIMQPAIISGQDDTLLELIPAAGGDFQLAKGAGNSQNYGNVHFKVIVIRNGAQPATWDQLEKAMAKFTGAGRVIL